MAWRGPKPRDRRVWASYVDALTLSMARSVSPLATAALAIAVGVFANTALKAGIAVAFGDRQFAMRVGGTLAASAAVGAGVIVAQWA